MKKALVIIITNLLIFSIALSGCTEEDNNNETTSIQELINKASAGDIINIPAGVYKENIVIDKSLTLLGENKDTTIIDGNGQTKIVTINSDNVKISGFTIFGKKSNFSHNAGFSGIYITSNSNTITDNNITFNDYGIYLSNSNNNDINNNLILKNTKGIYIEKSNQNIVKNNLICGFWKHYIPPSSNPNIMTDNIVIVTSPELSEGIALINSSDNFILDNQINNNKISGISFDYSDNNKISGNDIYENYRGMLFLSFDTSSGSNNSIYKNTISDNDYGITPRAASDNRFYHNNFINNSENIGAIWFQEYGLPNNYWDNDTEGNYWDDYTGLDEDGNGIGDTPYVIEYDYAVIVSNGDLPVLEQDVYPLMNSVDI